MAHHPTTCDLMFYCLFLLPIPFLCIYRGPRASFNKQSSHSGPVHGLLIDRGSSQVSHLRGVSFNCIYMVIPYRRKGVIGGRLPWFDSSKSYVKRRSSCVRKSLLGFTLPARKFFPSPPRCSACDALPYVRLCVCSNSLLA